MVTQGEASAVLQALGETFPSKIPESLAGYEGYQLPQEFEEKLVFDCQNRSQFQNHPLIKARPEGVEGFSKRLTQCYRAMVALRVEGGYHGNVMMLWNQDLVYLLAELLCYFPEPTAVAVCIWMEHTLLVEAAAEMQTAELGEKIRRHCPLLTQRLTAEGAFEACVFGLYRAHCTTLFTRFMGGSPIVPLIWTECIRGGSLRPALGLLVVLLQRNTHEILQSYSLGQGFGRCGEILARSVQGTGRDQLHALIDKAVEISQEPTIVSDDDDLEPYRDAPLVPLVIATFFSFLCPLAYGQIPSWALQGGPRALPPLIQGVITLFEYGVVWLVLSLSGLTSVAWGAILAIPFIVLPVCVTKLIYPHKFRGQLTEPLR